MDLKTSQKILDYATRQQVRADVDAGVKDGELKTSIYRRLAVKHGVSVRTIERVVNGL